MPDHIRRAAQTVLRRIAAQAHAKQASEAKLIADELIVPDDEHAT
jgi:hypothetical protein